MIKSCDYCGESFCDFCDGDTTGKNCSEKCYEKLKLKELGERLETMMDMKLTDKSNDQLDMTVRSGARRFHRAIED
jgi:hypothetical protein